MDAIPDASVTTANFHQFRQVLINTLTLFGDPGLHCLAGKGTIPSVPVPFLTDELANKAQYSTDDEGSRSLISDFDLSADRLALSPVGLIQYTDALKEARAEITAYKEDQRK